MERLAPTPTPRRVSTRRKYVALAGAVVLVVALLLAVRLTAEGRLERWRESCASSGGAVQTVEKGGRNPLVTESEDPTYECRTADGQILSNWR